MLYSKAELVEAREKLFLSHWGDNKGSVSLDDEQLFQRYYLQAWTDTLLVSVAFSFGLLLF